MHDHRPGGGHEALGALQPNRQAGKLWPLGGRVALHLGRVEDIAGLGQQVGAALGGLCGGPLELPADRPVRRCVASARQLLVEDDRRSLLTTAHLSADLLPLLEARPAAVLVAGDLSGGPEHQHVHAPVFLAWWRCSPEQCTTSHWPGLLILFQLCVNSAPILRIHESTQENWAVVVSISYWNYLFL